MIALNCCFKKKAVDNDDTPQKIDVGSRDAEYYEFLAPSVYHLQNSFLKQIADSPHLKYNATIYDIEDLGNTKKPGLIRKKGLETTCPIDGELGSAYVHAIDEEENDDHVGTATHMLSYTWGYRFTDIVDTLVSYCNDKNLDTKRTYIWICCLCNNQHRITERVIEFEEFQDTFEKRVSGIGHILAMMAPWDSPGYLKRVWCIFEMYTAHSIDECKIEVVMSTREKEKLLNSVQREADSQGNSGLDDLFDALSNTKVENAHASLEADKENILQIVANGPGCYELNVVINGLLREWVRDIVFDAAKDAEERGIASDNDYEKVQIGTFIANCGSYFAGIGDHETSLKFHQSAHDTYATLGNTEEATELTARCYNNIGTEYEALGLFEKALESHTKCREAFEIIYGTTHENTSTSYFNIGAVYTKLGREDEALRMYKTSLDIDIQIKGENHTDVANSYAYIGRMLQKNEKYDKASVLFQRSLDIRVLVHGDDHPNTATGYGDLGLLEHMRGNYDSAIELHQKSLIIQEKMFGKDSPDTAAVYQNMGGAYYEKGDFAKALKLHKKAQSAYHKSFQPDHPKCETSNAWVKLVEDAMDTAEYANRTAAVVYKT
jgi:tetratricopeptide (TPR) repeat protein